MGTPKISVDKTKTQADKIKVTNVYNKFWDSDSSRLLGSLNEPIPLLSKYEIPNKEKDSSSAKELQAEEPAAEEGQLRDQEGKENLIANMLEQNPRSGPKTSFTSTQDSEEPSETSLEGKTVEELMDSTTFNSFKTLYSKDRELKESASEETLSAEQKILPQDSGEEQIKNKIESEKDPEKVKDTSKKPVVSPKPPSKDSNSELAPGTKEKEEPKEKLEIAVMDPGSCKAEEAKKDEIQIYFQNLVAIDSQLKISDVTNYVNEDTELIEQEKRKCWRSLLSSVSRATSFSNASR